MKMKLKTSYFLHISPKTTSLKSKLVETVQYKDLIWIFVKKFFMLKYRQTLIGPAWLLLNPLLNILINSFIFGTVAGLSPDGIPQLLFYTCGNTIWSFFSTIILSNSNIFLSNQNLFSKVYFPRLSIPFSNTIISFFSFCIQFFFMILLMLYFSHTGNFECHISKYLLLLPFILLQLSLLGLGCGMIISSLVVKYRDMAVLIGFIVQIWMYMTPVVYSTKDIPQKIINLYFLNPAVPPISLFKYAFINIDYISFSLFIYSNISSLLIFSIGIFIFNSTEKNCIDIL